MGSTLADAGLPWAYVLRTWKALDVPEGWRPEITPEGIVMSPPPSNSHNLIADTVDDALRSAIDRSFAVFQTLGVAVLPISGIFIPDLCVVPRAAVPPGSEPVDARHVLVAVEIASKGNAEHDRKRKKWAYAHGPIAQYLLIDAFDDDGPMLSLFSNPVDGVYRNTVRVAFGEALKLADPVPAVVDSAQFPS